MSRLSEVDPRDVLADPTASNWLKAALAGALERDPVDAYNDVLALGQILLGHLRRTKWQQ